MVGVYRDVLYIVEGRWCWELSCTVWIFVGCAGSLWVWGYFWVDGIGKVVMIGIGRDVGVEVMSSFLVLSDV